MANEQAKAGDVMVRLLSLDPPFYPGGRVE
jgi:hypothetical protein